MRTVDYISQIKETADELKHLEKQETNPRVRKRLQLLRILKSGLTPYLTRACEMVGYSDKHGREIWQKYLAEGLTGYARLNYSREKRGKLSYAQEAQVNSRAAEVGFASHKEAQGYIFEQFGVCLAVSNVGKLFQRLEVRAKVPRPRNRRTSDEEQREYKKTTWGG
ncbi:MAG TPA: winged helix-turn-helix domain-containing protein [Pyrinomonadaceae bacterium]|nr:winged helix-turn-helix domain-containing protein [Pyrinomonadaceae bacterium]